MPFVLFQQRYFTAGAWSDPGLVRADNQDSYGCFAGSGVFAVSDGMGGGEGGARAARFVTDTLQRAVRAPVKDPAVVAELAYLANAQIVKYASEHHLRNMGATVVAMVLSAFKPHEAVVFHGGDSRCYRLRKNDLEQVTNDHTVSAAMGIPEEKLAKHLRGVLTNAAGCGSSFFVETQEIELADRDVYLLCSDGVARQLAESEIRKILMRDESAEARAKALVDLSLEKGGVDNATAVVVAFDRIPEASSDVRQEEAGVPEHAEWENEGNDVTPPTE